MPKQLDWLGEIAKIFAGFGPVWCVLGLFGAIVLIRFEVIVGALTKNWKTWVTTKQKLRHDQAAFELSIERRRAELNKPSNVSTLPQRKSRK